MYVLILPITIWINKMSLVVQFKYLKKPSLRKKKSTSIHASNYTEFNAGREKLTIRSS